MPAPHRQAKFSPQYMLTVVDCAPLYLVEIINCDNFFIFQASIATAKITKGLEEELMFLMHSYTTEKTSVLDHANRKK